MPVARFDLDRLRLEAAQRLPPTCFDDFQRLVRSILHGPQVQWLLVDAPDDALRKVVIAALDGVLRKAGLQVTQVPLGRAVPDIPTLERRLVSAAGRYDVVHVLGARDWFDAQAWDAFNVRRERIAATVKARLVFWLDPAAIALASQGAPDLWAWRAGVYAFRNRAASTAVVVAKPATEGFVRRNDPVDLRPMPDKHRRIAEIRAWLADHAEAPADLLVAPLDELGQLLRAVGDLRERAITMVRIADVLQVRGEIDEAFHILREEALPVFEKLGELRSRAIIMGQIADVLQARGELDEALRIRRNEELLVYDKLGDLRERAITMGKIADVLQARGELDEALRIFREELLPVFEKLGDLRLRAITMGRIAEVLQACGDHDEALRIRREDQLPVYEKLGDLHSRAIIMVKIALELWRRQERVEAAALFSQAHSALKKTRLPEAEALAGDMRALGLDVPEA